MRTIRIFARKKEIVTKREGELKDIMEFSYTKDGETFYQVKLTKEVKKFPNETGYYLIDVEDENMTLKETKSREMFKPNDIIWVSKINNFKRDTEYEKQLRDEQTKIIKKLFD